MAELLSESGEVEGYCGNPSCPVRDVTVEVKLNADEEALTQRTKWIAHVAEKRSETCCI